MLELNLQIHTSPVIASADYSFHSTFYHSCSSSVVLPRHSPSTVQSSTQQETSGKAHRNPGNSGC